MFLRQVVCCVREGRRWSSLSSGGGTTKTADTWNTQGWGPTGPKLDWTEDWDDEGELTLPAPTAPQGGYGMQQVAMMQQQQQQQQQEQHSDPNLRSQLDALLLQQKSRALAAQYTDTAPTSTPTSTPEQTPPQAPPRKKKKKQLRYRIVKHHHVHHHYVHQMGSSTDVVAAAVGAGPVPVDAAVTAQASPLPHPPLPEVQGRPVVRRRVSTERATTPPGTAVQRRVDSFLERFAAAADAVYTPAFEDLAVGLREEVNAFVESHEGEEGDTARQLERLRVAWQGYLAEVSLA